MYSIHRVDVALLEVSITVVFIMIFNKLDTS